jgi:HlyD family secretion protein
MIDTAVTKPNGKTPHVIGPPPVTGRKAVPRRLWLAGIAVLLVAVSAGAWFWLRRSQSAPVYVTVPLAKQDLLQTVTASGTVNPQNTVSVGTQVSGTIQSIYVDFNSRVHVGEILAKLDPSTVQTQLDQALATLAQIRAQAVAAGESASGAKFSVNAATAAAASANASVTRAQSALTLAQQTLSRDRALLVNGYISQAQFDADQANETASDSAMRSAQAAAAQYSAQTMQSASGAAGSTSNAQAAQAAVQAAEATVRQDQLNLQRTIIQSPVDGTVVARNVSIGQTVASSFQTPTLFTVAQDLKKMEVDIAVGEPDIGDVHPGESVTFTVLAYPARSFRGTVSQVRVNPATVANVVTYTVIVLVSNNDSKLLPGMTANASITIAAAKDAFVVPAQALAYRSKASAGSAWGKVLAGTAGAVVAGGNGTVFVLRNGAPEPVTVHVALVAGTQVAISPLRGSLHLGDPIILSDGSSLTQTPRSGTPPAGLGRAIR